MRACRLLSLLTAGLLVAVLLLAALQGGVRADSPNPDSWDMTDRFFGFRYHMLLEDNGSLLSDADYNGVAASIQQKADQLGCFGWVQRPSGGSAMVGEARCGKDRGLEMRHWLQSSGSFAHKPPLGVDVRVYPDTKIRLHFATFKVLDSGRDTCFLEPPHQCGSDSLDDERRRLLRQAGMAAKEEL